MSIRARIILTHLLIVGIGFFYLVKKITDVREIKPRYMQSIEEPMVDTARLLADAPCSGVRMLWFGLFLAALIAAWGRLGNVRSAALLFAALALVIGANVIRATILFFKEAGIVALPEWTHAGIGLLIFAAAAALIARLAQPKEARPCCG